ncbi:MAG: T9SS type A sorting domain-containing protein [Bacteroidetes bacterium]|nr:T9SS type A sorting domain-containing protein [Bacteroidota bacterium]
MKVFILILGLSVFAHLNTKSQQTKAIAEKAIWITLYQGHSAGSDSYGLFKTGNDTLINGKNYIKLFVQSVYQVGPSTYLQLSNLSYGFAFRNDTNKKAYIIPSTDSIEHLWYDFNLKIGDTLPCNQAWYSTSTLYSNEKIIVTAIDSVLFGSTYYKRFRFNHPIMKDLVMGVGFLGDLIRDNHIYFEYNISLKTFCPDTSLSNCNIIMGIDKIEKATKDIFIYPNPTTSVLNIDFLNPDLEINKINIREITGKQLKNIDLYNNENRFSIDLNLNAGIYFVELQGKYKTWIQKIVIAKN